MTTPLFDNRFEGYAYSYPHKHSYRPIDPVLLSDLWADEKKDALFLYVHLPFCEMRCGFCNLFTIANPQENVVDAYLKTLALEAATLKEVVAPDRFGQMAVGGGTPTFLNLPQLEKLFAIIRRVGAEPRNMPVSFEMSPKTIDREKLALLKNEGVDRVSMGVQSFLETEVKSLGRPQKNSEVYTALELMKQCNFETVNIDLIYGAYGQTLSSWLYSVQEAIHYKVDELFIYPLYVRALTGINKLETAPADNRFLFYKAGKELLLSSGYEQVSMRLFRLKKERNTAPVRYACQEDGMIGMGAGARSYTKALHYSSEYAVARDNIKTIINSYVLKNRADFEKIDYGITLTAEEQKRRFIIKSVLHSSGLNIDRYQMLYHRNVGQDFPQLKMLMNDGLAQQVGDIICLTSEGVDYSDAIGPWLYSASIKQLINSFELK